jgi:hypothetical protein
MAVRVALTTAAILVVAHAGVGAEPWERLRITPCGVSLSVPKGWSSHAIEAFPGTCDFEVRPASWRPDPECPERLGGRVQVTVSGKPVVPTSQPYEPSLLARPTCPSGWYGTGGMEGGQCLSVVDDRRSALTGEVPDRVYCRGRYAGVGEGLMGVVFGEDRLAYLETASVDLRLFDKVVASMRFMGRRRRPTRR